MLKGICQKFDSFYFVGIGGVSMSAICKWLLSCGKRVAGSDIAPNEYTQELCGLGVRVETGEETTVDQFDAVVYTDAVRDDDRRIVIAKKAGKFIISRGQLLYEMSKNFNTVIAVSGCHGKTTCTAMLAHIFCQNKSAFCAHIGGRDIDFKNFVCYGYDYFITEACEYKKNFLLLKPDVSVVLNCRPDHLECYGSEQKLKTCYAEFASSGNISVGLYGDGIEGLTFGYAKEADYHSGKIKGYGGIYSFDAYEGECLLGRIDLHVYGKHNILNALAAIAVARSTGVPFCAIKRGLESFKGVERRFERLGEHNGAEWIADYAHHPDEIAESIRTAKKFAKGKIYTVFQPHTYSRTKNLFNRFVRVLSGKGNMMIYRTYAARETYDDKGSAFTLYTHVKKSAYGEEPRDIAAFVKRAGEGDVVLFLGAGDIYGIAKQLSKTL